MQELIHIIEYKVVFFAYLNQKDMHNTTDSKEITIKTDSVNLSGILVVPEYAKGIIIFVHGSGSSRYSPRNQQVAKILQEKGFATLLFDLLSPEEDKIYGNRFDINLLTGRLIEVSSWIMQSPQTTGLAIGFFGASTGAASALKAAALLGPVIKAVVSRGGRPDLAMPFLEKVNAATLLVIGERDKLVLQLNDQAYQNLFGIKKMELIPNATHLFPEEGKLEEVAELAAEWFQKYLK